MGAHESHKSFTLSHIKNNQINVSQRSVTLFEAMSNHLGKNIISIAVNLYRIKELRDFFIDVTEKVIDTCKINELESLKNCWTKFMNAFSKCTLQLYPQSASN